jgi:hypothetical protein
MLEFMSAAHPRRPPDGTPGYGEGQRALPGGGPLRTLKSIFTLGKAKSDVPLPENTSVEPGYVVPLGKGVVREGSF